MLAAFEPLVLELAERLRARGERLVTAESCTGGLIAAACTAVAGSSDWLERGHVTYSNEAKTEQLGVPAALIAEHGAVSEPVVQAMARGALDHARADWSVAVTGIAGPGGGSRAKPVGTVWLALAHRSGPVRSWVERFDGDRAAVRTQTVDAALRALVSSVDAASHRKRGGPGDATGSAAGEPAVGAGGGLTAGAASAASAASGPGAGHAMPPLPTIAAGRYRHYKGGEYEVLGVVRHSETVGPLVLYRPLGEGRDTWVRPYAMFLETVDVDGVVQPRFRRVDA